MSIKRETTGSPLWATTFIYLVNWWGKKKVLFVYHKMASQQDDGSYKFYVMSSISTVLYDKLKSRR